MSKDKELGKLPKQRRISPEFAEILHMLSSLEKTSPPVSQQAS